MNNELLFKRVGTLQTPQNHWKMFATMHGSGTMVRSVVKTTLAELESKLSSFALQKQVLEVHACTEKIVSERRIEARQKRFTLIMPPTI